MKLALPCPVLPLHRREEAARRLGISVEDVVEILYAERAWRDGNLMDAHTFFDAYPDDAIDEFTGAGAFPDDLTSRDLEVPRDPREHLTPPISPADVWAADVAARVFNIEQMIELDVPSAVLRDERTRLQATCERMPDAARAADEPWPPLRDVIDRPPVPPGTTRVPSPLLTLLGDDAPAIVPRRAAFLPAGLLVQFRFASVVIAPDGEVRDVFPTCGLHAVGGDAHHALFVDPDDAAAFVRDVAGRRWSTGPIPDALPRFAAVTIGDARWPIIFDVVTDRHHSMAVTQPGSDAGAARPLNSSCGHYVWDGTRFVREASTNVAVLDARNLTTDARELLSFARAADGWRFLIAMDDTLDAHSAPAPSWRIVDERGAIVRERERAL